MTGSPSGIGIETFFWEGTILQFVGKKGVET
jgi:hypothetical protein